jgi:hypothetical protein
MKYVMCVQTYNAEAEAVVGDIFTVAMLVLLVAFIENNETNKVKSFGLMLHNIVTLVHLCSLGKRHSVTGKCSTCCLAEGYYMSDFFKR